MRIAPKLDIVFAAEAVVPAVGGAERFWHELMAHLAVRHAVRAVGIEGADAAVGAAGAPGRSGDDGRPAAVPPSVDWLPVPAPSLEPTWRGRAARREALVRALGETLAERPADVVAGQLHGGPAAVTAARQAGTTAVLFVPGYEALCHWAFGTGSECVRESRCRDCPRALRLDDGERRALWAARDAQDEALAAADVLVAPSAAMASAVERACGRRPLVAAPVGGAPARARAGATGHVAAMASIWTRDKGVELLAPIAALVPDRQVLVQVPPGGIPPAEAGALEALPNVTLRTEPGTIDDLLDGAAVLVAPSQIDEPFGRVVFEGLAAGVPTLAPAAGGPAGMVPAGQLVEARGDPGAWAAAIRGLEDEARWREVRDAGLAAARRVLDTRPLERIEAALADAVERARSGAP